jgi:hypothetical protein
MRYKMHLKKWQIKIFICTQGAPCVHCTDENLYSAINLFQVRFVLRYFLIYEYLKFRVFQYP